MKKVENMPHLTEKQKEVVRSLQSGAEIDFQSETMGAPIGECTPYIRFSKVQWGTLYALQRIKVLGDTYQLTDLGRTINID